MSIKCFDTESLIPKFHGSAISTDMLMLFAKHDLGELRCSSTSLIIAVFKTSETIYETVGFNKCPPKRYQA